MDALPAHNQANRKSAKHGFPLVGAPAPGRLRWRIRKTMLIRFAAMVVLWGRVAAGFLRWAVHVLSMVSALVD